MTKKEHWKEIKSNLLKDTPKKFKIEVVGMDQDGEYYHPHIIVDDKYHITMQCDINHDVPYAHRLESTDKINSHMFSIYINDYQYIINNWDIVKERLLRSHKLTESIYNMIGVLEKTVNDIACTTVEKIINEEKIKDACNKLYQVTEFLENNRLVD